MSAGKSSCLRGENLVRLTRKTSLSSTSYNQPSGGIIKQNTLRYNSVVLTTDSFFTPLRPSSRIHVVINGVQTLVNHETCWTFEITRGGGWSPNLIGKPTCIYIKTHKTIMIFHV